MVDLSVLFKVSSWWSIKANRSTAWLHAIFNIIFFSAALLRLQEDRGHVEDLGDPFYFEFARNRVIGRHFPIAAERQFHVNEITVIAIMLPISGDVFFDKVMRSRCIR